MEVISHYRIVRKLGAGGMGEVYLAYDTQLARKVAIKVLTSASDNASSRRLMREAQAAASLDHPNICSVYDVGEHEGSGFIVMQYVEGQTLAVRLRSGALDEGTAITLARQIAAGLAEAHGRGIIHRDIKPDNIMLDARGQAKVMDFGIAKIVSLGQNPDTTKTLLTAAGAVVGTLPYMSPEQVRGREVDARSDVFSFGVLLYEMLSGHRAFSDATAADTASAILTCDPPPLRVDPRLGRIVRKCLDKEADRRYESMRGVSQDLEAISTRAISWSGLRWVAAFFLLLVLVAGAWWFYRRRGAGPEIRSLAVLPLRNTGGDSQDEYLCDGITDEMITKLTYLRNLRVTSYSVATRYKDSTKDAAAIGRELGVDAVLHGTLRKSGSRFRMSMHLVNVPTGFEIWADNGYESDVRDVLTAERQVAEAVAAQVKGQLSPEERAMVARAGTSNTEAYELLLRGKEHFYNAGSTAAPGGGHTERSLARQMFQNAIALDPNFAEAYGWLALAQYYEFHVGNAAKEMLNASLDNAHKALAKDPNLIIARRALIHIYHSTGQTEDGLRQAKRILETNSGDPDALEAAGLGYFRAGMMDRAIPLLQRAVAADPLNASFRNELARSLDHNGEAQRALEILAPTMANPESAWVAALCYRSLGQFEQAIAMERRCLAAAPLTQAAWFDLGGVYIAAGRAAEARATWTEGARVIESQVAKFENFRTRIWLGLLYAALGRRDQALAQTRIALALEPADPWALYHAGCIRALLGDRNEALRLIRRALDNGFLSLHYVTGYQRLGFPLHSLRNDPGLHELTRSLEQRVNELRARY